MQYYHSFKTISLKEAETFILNIYLQKGNNCLISNQEMAYDFMSLYVDCAEKDIIPTYELTLNSSNEERLIISNGTNFIYEWNLGWNKIS